MSEKSKEVYTLVGKASISCVDVLIYHIHAYFSEVARPCEEELTTFLVDKGRMEGAIALFHNHIVEIKYGGHHYSILLSDINTLVNTVKDKFQLAREGKL